MFCFPTRIISLLPVLGNKSKNGMGAFLRSLAAKKAAQNVERVSGGSCCLYARPPRPGGGGWRGGRGAVPQAPPSGWHLLSYPVSRVRATGLADRETVRLRDPFQPGVWFNWKETRVANKRLCPRTLRGPEGDVPCLLLAHRSATHWPGPLAHLHWDSPNALMMILSLFSRRGMRSKGH